MRFARFHGFAGVLVVLVLSRGALAAGGDAEWQHSHGHGGGGVTAIGTPGDSSKVSRTITLEVGNGTSFTPSTISVKRGETIRFVVKNSGGVKHEMVLGTEGQLLELYHTRMRAPNKTLVTPSGITVDAGKSGEIIWEFTKFGTVSFGCLLPGHYDAGERGTVIVQ